MVQMMLHSAGLCDSDKYSICLMSEKLGNSFPNGISQKIGERLQMSDMPIPEEKEKTLEEELRSYIQSFYRFSQIFIHRNAFPNPFKQNLLFADCKALEPWAEDCTRLKRWADYVFQFKNYAMALALYERIPSAERDAEILMHRAFCLECMHRLEEARSHGDLSENSEYDEAKNTQGLVENRIAELEQTIKNAVLIDESELSVDNVSVGTHVTIRETGEDEAEEYDIVGRTEADAFNGKISDESPVGHALMGKAVGEKVEVLLPTGQTVEYTVLAITHSAN